jgi:hypothetical protein
MKIGTLILSLFLTAIILFNSLCVSFTYVYYYLDTEGFIEMLCENTDKPELECNGKCQLKKVTESTSSETESLAIMVDFKEITLFVEQQKEYIFCTCKKENKQLFYYNNLYTFTNSSLLYLPSQT